MPAGRVYSRDGSPLAKTTVPVRVIAEVPVLASSTQNEGAAAGGSSLITRFETATPAGKLAAPGVPPVWLETVQFACGRLAVKGLRLARVLPAHLAADVDRSTWTPQPVFGLIARLGGVERAEVERTLNQGIGMVAVVAAGSADRALERLAARGVEAWVAGAVRSRGEGETGDAPAKGGGGGAVTLTGTHPQRHSP